jgi:hypothetical protein
LKRLLFVFIASTLLAACASNAGAPAPQNGASFASPLPSATPGVTLSNLQNQLGPGTTCSGTPCATGPIASPQPAATFSIATNVSAPSLSGSSTRLTVVADTNHEDVLFFTPPLPFSLPLATSFTWDFWFTIDQPLVDAAGKPVGPVEALEFDSNIGLLTFGYNFSSQCVIQTGNVWVWQIWGFTGNGTEQNWVNSGMTCDPATFTPFPAWHHVVWTYSVNPSTQAKQYLNLSFDGTNHVPTQNAIGQAEAKTNQRQSVEVQFQIDARPVSPTNTTPVFNEWVDNVTFSYR